MTRQPNISSLTPKRIPGLTSGNQSTNKEVTKLVDDLDMESDLSDAERNFDNEGMCHLIL